MAKHPTDDPYSRANSGRRYLTYDTYLRRTHGGKCVKIPLDAGFSCPNIDGTCARGGCIYCSGRGSGDFAPPATVPLREQYDRGRASLAGKWPTDRCIPYFQAHTNTHAPADTLRPLFEEVLAYPFVVGMNIATRADCLPPDVIDLLCDLSERTVLSVELGLQTAHDRTADRINRGHTFADFADGYARLRAGAPRARICVHLIFGLPGESEEDMLETVRLVSALRPDEVKLHLLHVLRATALARMYGEGKYIPMEEDAYIRTVVRALELLPPDTVVSRLTGDGVAADLIAPLWSRRKREVLGSIDRLQRSLDTWQGKKYQLCVKK